LTKKGNNVTNNSYTEKEREKKNLSKYSGRGQLSFQQSRQMALLTRQEKGTLIKTLTSGDFQYYKYFASNI